MNLFENILEIGKYKIVEGAAYCWGCYGNNARFLRMENHDSQLSIVYDTVDKTVYEIEVYNKTQNFFWLNPIYSNKYLSECYENKIDPRGIYDEYKRFQCDLLEDILEKASLLMNGKDCDDKVTIPLSFSEEDMQKIMKVKGDLTFDEFIEETIVKAVNDVKTQSNKVWDDIIKTFDNRLAIVFRKNIKPYIKEEHKGKIIDFLCNNAFKENEDPKIVECYDKEVQYGRELLFNVIERS